ncbi:MAG: hypothetical protein AB1553_14680 [Nitrospirota bacterium]
MKNTVIFIIFVLVIVGLLYSISGKRHARIPDDVLHRQVSATDSAACMECHGPGKAAALKPEHPPKFECHKCHKSKRIRS